MSSIHDLPGEAALAPPRGHLRLVPEQPLDFDAVVRDLTPRLQRYAVRRLGDRHEAEEVVQEALLRAYKHRQSLLTEDDVTAWSTVVTGRLVIDRLRVRGRSTSVADVPETGRLGRDTAEVVVARDEARTALDALDAMPPRQAAVLWAREVEGLAYDEIGRRFGMTEPAVRSILTRARKGLRKEYEARGGTLPAAGMGLLAPWTGGLGWVQKLRDAMERAAAPAAAGALGLAVAVGGALSPFSPFREAPAQATPATAVPRADVAEVTARGWEHGSPRPTAAPAAAARPVDVAAPREGLSVRVDPLHLPGSGCTTYTTADGEHVGVGGGECPHTEREEKVLYVGPTLPDNPTGVRRVGVQTWDDEETTPVDLSQDCLGVPDSPVTQCETQPQEESNR